MALRHGLDPYRYAHSHPDARFRREADKLNLETSRLVETLLMQHRKQIEHPDPERAIRFGLLLIAFFLRGMIQMDAKRFEKFAPPRQALPEELMRMFLGYLGAGETSGTMPPGV